MKIFFIFFCFFCFSLAGFSETQSGLSALEMKLIEQNEILTKQLEIMQKWDKRSETIYRFFEDIYYEVVNPDSDFRVLIRHSYELFKDELTDAYKHSDELANEICQRWKSNSLPQLKSSGDKFAMAIVSFSCPIYLYLQE